MVAFERIYVSIFAVHKQAAEAEHRELASSKTLASGLHELGLGF